MQLICRRCNPFHPAHGARGNSGKRDPHHFRRRHRPENKPGQVLCHPIFDGEDNIQEIVHILGCQVQQFPIKYLGLPLSTKKVPKAQFQSLVETVARKMPPCHGSLMARSGRLVWIKSVLRAIPIYSMMAYSLPPWARKEIDAICRKFFWVGKDASVRGRCMVAWETCCRPTELGGLGITDLKLAGYALQTWWL